MFYIYTVPDNMEYKVYYAVLLFCMCTFGNNNLCGWNSCYVMLCGNTISI